jgi:hypothetical protein
MHMHPHVTHVLADTPQHVAPSWVQFLDATDQHRRTWTRATIAAVCVAAIAGASLLAFGRPVAAAALVLAVLASTGAFAAARRPTADAIQLFEELVGFDPGGATRETVRPSAVIVRGPWPTRPSDPPTS